jgi:hypothetical protein
MMKLKAACLNFANAPKNSDSEAAFKAPSVSGVLNHPNDLQPVKLGKYGKLLV